MQHSPASGETTAGCTLRKVTGCKQHKVHLLHQRSSLAPPIQTEWQKTGRLKDGLVSQKVNKTIVWWVPIPASVTECFTSHTVTPHTVTPHSVTPHSVTSHTYRMSATSHTRWHFYISLWCCRWVPCRALGSIFSNSFLPTTWLVIINVNVHTCTQTIHNGVYIYFTCIHVVCTILYSTLYYTLHTLTHWDILSPGGYHCQGRLSL